MKWNLKGDRPIYSQLVEQLERGILMGEFQPGSNIPSVRNLAIEAEVNPNTMQKALAELEMRGLLHTHRTAGRTVTEDRDMIENLKKDLAVAQIDLFFDGMESIGIDRNEAAKLIAAAAKNAGNTTLNAQKTSALKSTAGAENSADANETEREVM